MLVYCLTLCSMYYAQLSYKRHYLSLKPLIRRNVKIDWHSIDVTRELTLLKEAKSTSSFFCIVVFGTSKGLDLQMKLNLDSANSCGSCRSTFQLFPIASSCVLCVLLATSLFFKLLLKIRVFFFKISACVLLSVRCWLAATQRQLSTRSCRGRSYELKS